MLRLLVPVLVCASLVSAAETEDWVRKSVPASSARRLLLNSEFGAINIQAGGSKTVDVEVYFHGVPPSSAEFDRMLRDFRLDVVHEGSDVRITGTFEDGWTLQPLFWPEMLFGTGHAICRNLQCLEYSSWLREVLYSVTVPQQFSVDVSTSGSPISVDDLKGEVNARTSGGSLTFSRIGGPVNGRTSGGAITMTSATEKVVLRTSGGSIRVRDVSGDVDASTSGGSISIERASGRVRAHTSGGGISVREASGAVDASTSGGTVTASFPKQPAEQCHLSTSGGSINVDLGRDVHMNLDASTSGGRVSTNFPVPSTGDRHRRELRAPLNGGGPLLYLHTSGGGINIRRGA